MSGKRSTEEQIIYVVKQADAGTAVKEICRQLGVSEPTFCAWKKKYGGMGVSELRELRQLRDENQRLNRLVADLTLDKHIPQEVLLKKRLKPRRRRELANQASEWFDLSARRTCRLFGVSRSTFYCRSHARNHEALKMRLKELALTRVRFGYLRLTVLLCREGWAAGKKLVYRLYREMDLSMRTKKRRRLASRSRILLPAAEAPSER